MSKRATLLETWIEPKAVWAGIVRMLGYQPTRRLGMTARRSVATYGQERWVHTEIQP